MPIWKTSFGVIVTVLCFASDMEAQTNIYRRVDGVIYNPKLSKLWKQIPTFGEKYSVTHIRTNGVIFSADVLLKDGSWRNDGYVFIKNCPHRDTFYNQQALTEDFWALPIKNQTFPTKDGSVITVRAFDCGEPCDAPPPISGTK